MKVCFVAPKIYPLFENASSEGFGGAEVQMYYIGNELTKYNSFNICYIAGDTLPAECVKIGDIEIRKGVSTERTGTIRKLGRALKLMNTIRQVDADIYIQRTASEGTGLVAIGCKLFKKKFIYMTAHSIDCTGEFERTNGKVSAWLYRYGINHADRIITQTREQQTLLREHYNLQSHVLNSVYPVKNSEGCKKRTILWVGRCEEWKQPELFIELAKQLPNEECVMIAPPAKGVPELAQKIYQIAGHVTNLRLIKKVPFQEIDRYFSEAKIFVNTSRHEGFPNTFLQAWANKTPIISLNVKLDNIFEKYQCGVHASGDLQKLVSEIKSLLADEEKQRSLSENGFLYVKQNHNMERIVKQFSSLLYAIGE